MKFAASLLALCTASVAYAATVPRTFPPVHVDKVIDVEAYMAGNITSGVCIRAFAVPIPF
jgi:hypothetical protein